VTKLEAFFYALLYAYVFLGIGYLLYKIIKNIKSMRDTLTE